MAKVKRWAKDESFSIGLGITTLVGALLILFLMAQMVAGMSAVL
jgi:hypothetical protein